MPRLPISPARRAAPFASPVGWRVTLLIALSAGCFALLAIEAVELIHTLVVPSYWNVP